MYMYILLILYASNFCMSDESDRSLFPQLPVAPVNSKNELCKADSVEFLENLDNITLWSYQMWDATEKSTTGILQGNRFHMGNWDGCMKVKAPFQTRFCLVVVKVNIHNVELPDDPYAIERDPQGSVLMRILDTHDISQMPRDTVKIGWCVPASCTNEDLNKVLEDHFNRSKTHLTLHNVTYSGMVVEKLCHTQGEVISFDVLDIVFCVILAVVLLIVIIATIYEMKIEKLSEKEKQEYQKSRRHRIMIGFSARKNFVEMARADVSNSALSSLYGLRTVSMLMAVAGHKFIFSSSGPLLNFDDIEGWYRTSVVIMILQANQIVDTFFIMSGILATYGLLTQFKQKNANIFNILLLRYLRLTSVYAFVALFIATLFNYMGTGPLWKILAQQETEKCRNNWWTNLLYVNNYVNVEHMCMLQTWYLACDYHYYIVAFVVILLFTKKKVLGSLLFILCFLLSIAVPFIITVVYMRPGVARFFPDFLRLSLSHPDFILTYVKSHTRATPYCLGMLTGYVYYKMKGNKKQLSKLKSHTITLVSILLVLSGLASGLPIYDLYHEYNTLEAGIYAGFHRLAWSVGTIGLLLTASFGHATILQKTLSWSPFVPLSKLVYSLYIIHPSFQFRTAAMMLTPQRFDISTLITVALGDSCVSFVAALALYLLIEMPIMKLSKELLMPPKQTTSLPEPNPLPDNISNSNHIQ